MCSRQHLFPALLQACLPQGNLPRGRERQRQLCRDARACPRLCAGTVFPVPSLRDQPRIPALPTTEPTSRGTSGTPRACSLINGAGPGGAAHPQMQRPSAPSPWTEPQLQHLGWLCKADGHRLDLPPGVPADRAQGAARRGDRGRTRTSTRCTYLPCIHQGRDVI